MPLTDQQRKRVERLIYGEWESLDEFRAVLAEVETAAELHEVAENLNWDDGTEKLDALLEHPLCDRGTALMIYWLADPVYFSQYDRAEDISGSGRDVFRFLKRVESALLAQQFSTNAIAFDPFEAMGFNAIQKKQVIDNPHIPVELKCASRTDAPN